MPEWVTAPAIKKGGWIMKYVKETLKNILEYIGADMEYADYAELQTYLENLVKLNGGS